jgi:glycosyltransferase involved in cell wall biosynthesis
MKRALDCLVRQTYQNLEIIVSNDCSPNPEIQDILDQYADNDPRIRLFYQKKDLGIYGNYYFVLQQATGKYFMYAQDDDMWGVDCISSLVEELERCPECAFAVSAAMYVDPDGNEFATYRIGDESLTSLIVGEKTPFMWMGLFRLDILKLFDNTPDDIHGKDVIIIAEILLSHPFRYVDRVLYTKTLYHHKSQKYVRDNPFCLLQMYKHLIHRTTTSQFIPLKNKVKLVYILPVAGVFVARAYAAQVLYLLPVDHPVRKCVRSLCSR